MDYQPYLPGFGSIEPGYSRRTTVNALLSIRYAPLTWYTMRALAGLIKELEDVARTRSKDKPPVSVNKEFRFINVALDDSAYEDIMDRYSDGDALMDAFQVYMETGYKFSFALNGQNDLVICSMTDRRPNSVTENACLTGGADSWYDALKVVLYKHEVILLSDWSKASDIGATKRRLL